MREERSFDREPLLPGREGEVRDVAMDVAPASAA
jgi:hypothetical protein